MGDLSSSYSYASRSCDGGCDGDDDAAAADDDADDDDGDDDDDMLRCFL